MTDYGHDLQFGTFITPDAAHADRVIELLCAEAARFRHCIVTTHATPWRDRYRSRGANDGDCQLVELGAWSASGGLTVDGAAASPDSATEPEESGAPW